MFCAKCGNSLPGSDAFCTRCGAAVVGPAVSSAAAAVRQAPQPAQLHVPPPPSSNAGRNLTIVSCVVLSIFPIALLHGFAAFLAICLIWLSALIVRSKSSPNAKVIFVGSAFAIVLFANVLEGWLDERDRARAIESQKAQAANAAKAVEKAKEDFDSMSPADHLAKARGLLNPATAGPITIAEGMRHLRAVPPRSDVAADAAAFKKQFEIEKRKHDLQAEKDAKALAAAQRTLQIALRDAAAKKMEETFLDGGYNVDVNATGADHTTLRIKYVLASKVFVHQMEKVPDFFENARKLGFKKVVLTDGYDSSWTWTL
jgi:hypothetical protein